MSFSYSADLRRSRLVYLFFVWYLDHNNVISGGVDLCSLVCAGAGCYSCNENVTEEDKKVVEHLFASCGFIHEVPEQLMDAVCGLSGSGPAYVYIFIESLTGQLRSGQVRSHPQPSWFSIKFNQETGVV